MSKRIFMFMILVVSTFFVWCIFPEHSYAASSISSDFYCKQDAPTISLSIDTFFKEDNNTVQPSNSPEVDDEEENERINWTTVFGIILGAVLGFISSVTVGLLTKFASAHRLLNKMKQELEEIRSYIIDNVNADDRFLSISPIWEYIIHSDTLFSFSTKKYASIVRIYEAMQTFKRAEESANTSKEALVKSRKVLIDIIERYKL